MMKPKSNKQVQIDFIVLCLSNGEERGKILGKVGKKWGTSRTTFDRLLQIAREQHKQERVIIEKEIKDNNLINAINDVKSGLKTKLERQLFYQNEIAVMEKQLRGELEFTFIVGGSLKVSHAETKEGRKFMLPIQIQNDLRDSIKSYCAEISKMEGEYAPTKTDITTKGEAINHIPIHSWAKDDTE